MTKKILPQIKSFSGIRNGQSLLDDTSDTEHSSKAVGVPSSEQL